ncbi:MAG TPA: helix-turn-helix transcriptional regulator [Candidatus Angelobacter sp.]|jgi:transcriptional regulator with XRE-family HTH domain|nr:helix-turn-helix transcriptional regulator [Candidatus Angelobacter sp.]
MEPIQRALGNKIRELRKAKGWAQEAFAHQCGMHRGHMGQIERGESNLTLSTLLIIAEKLETTVSVLFEDIA